MSMLSEDQALDRIAQLQPFTAEIEGTGLWLRIDDYVPYIAAAIHAGHRLRKPLQSICLLDEAQRLYEEDPATEQMIADMPIQILGLDSRYEYDLNRPLARAVYQVAWGQQVWRHALSAKQKSLSWNKHKAWYRIVETLVSQLENKHGACLIFDIHSYNYQRVPGDPPSFNLGLEQVDLARWGRVVNHYEKQLKQQFQSQNHRVARNDVFQGMGYLNNHMNSHFAHTCVLPTEVKKFYMDECEGRIFPKQIEVVKQGLIEAMTNTSQYFVKQHVKHNRIHIKTQATSRDVHDLKDVDTKLYHLAKGINTLQAITPLNLQNEKQKFLKKEGRYTPNFIYKPLAIDPYWFREQLYRLPVHRIEHSILRGLYRDVVDMLAVKVDLLTSIGTDRFLYNSLRYYGEPKDADLRNAAFIMQAPAIPNEQQGQSTIDAAEAVDRFKQQVMAWGYDCQVSIGRKMVAKALVNHNARTLLVNQHSRFTETDIQALSHHELGVHMVTTLNSKAQPLKVLELGLPGNTRTQEGIAILMENLSGNLTLNRLRTLALRVLAVHAMIQHNDIQKTFLMLREHYNVASESAFDIAIRVHRGGGFTKDFLYLSGLRDALNLYRENTITPLLIGKTGFDYYEILHQLIEEGTLESPRWISPALTQPVNRDPVLDYLVSAIR